MKNYSIRLTDEMMEWLQLQAEALDTNVSALVRGIILEEIEETSI